VNKDRGQSNGTARIVTTERVKINESEAGTVYNTGTHNVNETSTKAMQFEESSFDTNTVLTRLNTSNVIMFNNIEISGSENSNQPLMMKCK
jgi:hypothetical protein